MLIIPILVGAMLALSACEDKTTSQIDTRTLVAKVNGQPIYMDQLESQVQSGIDKYQRFNNNMLPAGLTFQLQEKALDQYIVAELIYQESLKLNEAEIEKEIAATIEQHKGENRDEASIKRQLYIEQYLIINDLNDPQVPEHEVREYYEKSKENFVSKKDVSHVRHIVITIDKEASNEDKAVAKNKIEEVLGMLRKGEAFDEMAKEYSQDANSISGGDLGYIEKGFMPKEFEDVAFSLEPGTISNVIQTDIGYHILEVLDRKPAGTIPDYESVRDFLAAGLNSQLKNKKVITHINKLKDEADIEILLANTD